jgi:hypothetical protein
MSEPQQGTRAIDSVLRRLCEHFGRDSFSVVEQWDDDTCAVGVSGATDAASLVYISTCGLPEGRYDVTVERADEAGSARTDDGGGTLDGADHFVGLDFDGLAALVATRLQLRTGRGRR